MLLQLSTPQTDFESAHVAMTPLTSRLAKWAVGAKSKDFPDDVRASAGRAILDTLGVTAAGAAHKKVAALAQSFPQVQGGCLTATGHMFEASHAATVNGMAAHVWDFDDNSYTGMIHGSAIVLPAILAVAHEISASDDEVVGAFIVGSEITYTLGEIVGHGHFLQGWWATGSLALIGAVAGVCRLYGFSVDKATQAIAMAAVSAGIERAIAGTDTKSYLCGHVAARAIMLSRASAAGLTGPENAFEHPNGFFALLQGGSFKLGEVESLGQRWRLCTPGLQFKTSPVCSATHAAIELTSELLKRAGKQAEDIDTVLAELPKLARSSLVFDRPSSVQEAQFSLPYCIACAALHGRVRLEDLEQQAIFDPQKERIVRAVRIETADDLSRPPSSIDFPESTRLSLTFNDGSCVTGFCGEAYGMPNRPLSEFDLVAKFEACLAFVGRSNENAPPAREVMSLTRHAFGFSTQ